MTRVLVLTPYPYGTVAGPRSSFELWERVLADAGITLDYAVFESDRLHEIIYEPVGTAAKAVEMARSYVRYLPSVRRAADYDAVLVNREAALVGPAVLERWVARMGKPIIYQLDDPLYVPYRSVVNGSLAYLKFFGKVATICRLSSVVIANSSHHVEFARRHNSNVWEIPSLVDGEVFNYDASTAARAEPDVCVGWTGSLTTVTNLHMIRRPLRRVALRGDARLLFVGANEFDMNDVPHEARPWSADTEVEAIRSFDIGLLPVPDSPWNRRKFFLKLVQYMALGIPAIATPLGSNTEVLVPGKTGLFANTETEWLQAMEELIGDRDRRLAMGERAAAIAHERYTLQANAERIVAAFESAVHGSRRRSPPIPRSASKEMSVVVTVRNDREGLRELLRALQLQTRPPDEIVIVDGGSIDGTLDVLSEFDFNGIALKVEVRPGANIAAGRNAGIGLASHDRIALTDAGCRPVAEWLAALEEGLGEADLVNGIFVTDAQTPFEQILAVTHYPRRDELHDVNPLVKLSHRLFGRQYLPYAAGGRSMAFTRRAWQAVGGFPEYLYAGEEQAFARALRDHGVRAKLTPAAAVSWRPRKTWSANAKMFYRYCRGDVRSKGHRRHVVRVVAWTAGPTAAIRGGWRERSLVALGGLAYIALPLRRAHTAGISMRSWWRIPVAVATKDIAQILGAAHGTLDALRGIPQPIPQPPPLTPDGVFRNGHPPSPASAGRPSPTADQANARSTPST